ncbi:ExeA family protein [Ectobacillus antri]|uniref:ExeA family protein n=1 Tax=Ectobacillus antri TaxID=2486280 RepID=UPI000F5B5AA0|nr:AAA family ATPase [Ectobacillus antri]
MIEQHFGWNGVPFQRHISTNNLYLSEQFKETQARLQFMIQQREFGMLTGYVGAGKTTAIRALRDSLSSSEHVFLYMSDSSLQPRDFYREMLIQLGIEPKFLVNDVKRQFKAALMDIYVNKGRTPIVVIDEAHLLSATMLQEIRFLTNFQIDSLSPLALILVGQPELREKLKISSLEAISQRITTRFHLTGLGEEELASYVSHQLKVVGEEQQIFSTAALREIYKHTKGILRLTNRMCTDCLLDIVIQKQKVVDADTVERVLIDQSY